MSPSRLLARGRFDVRSALRPGDAAARQHGILVHRLLQEIEWLETFRATDEELLALLRPLGTAAAGREALAMVRKALPTGAAQQVLARNAFPAGARVAVWRERRFLVRVAEGLLQGSFDRVVVVSGPAGPVAASVVDFKTDAVRDPSQADALAAAYAPQLDAYRRAAAALTGLAPERVTARLWFLAADRLT